MSALFPPGPFPVLPQASAAMAPASGAPPDPALRAAAERFEAVFWAEMLRHAGLASPRGSFGGGVGEARFAPMLVQEYATLLAREGRAGIAERVYAALRDGGAE